MLAAGTASALATPDRKISRLECARRLHAASAAPFSTLDLPGIARPRDHCAWHRHRDLYRRAITTRLLGIQCDWRVCMGAAPRSVRVARHQRLTGSRAALPVVL